MHQYQPHSPTHHQQPRRPTHPIRRNPQIHQAATHPTSNTHYICTRQAKRILGLVGANVVGVIGGGVWLLGGSVGSYELG